jgi:dihydropteroate synthase
MRADIVHQRKNLKIFSETASDYNSHRGAIKSRTQIMGVINVTPDSFTGDGLIVKGLKPSQIVKYAQEFVSQGADIIDVGGESSRPGSEPVPLKEELRRTIPVIECLKAKIDIPISIDTYKPEVAKRALESGASIVNDITGLRNFEMIKVIAKTDARVIIMHMKGMPRDMQQSPQYDSLIDEIIEFLDRAINRAVACGIGKERIIIDPGIGFGKTVEHNLEIIRRLGELKVLGCPILVGTSRKSFIGKILNLPPQERLSGTLASLAVAIMNGANILRVHDVKFTHQAVKIVEAIIKGSY